MRIWYKLNKRLCEEGGKKPSGQEHRIRLTLTWLEPNLPETSLLCDIGQLILWASGSPSVKQMSKLGTRSCDSFIQNPSVVFDYTQNKIPKPTRSHMIWPLDPTQHLIPSCSCCFSHTSLLAFLPILVQSHLSRQFLKTSIQIGLQLEVATAGMLFLQMWAWFILSFIQASLQRASLPILPLSHHLFLSAMSPPSASFSHQVLTTTWPYAYSLAFVSYCLNISPEGQLSSMKRDFVIFKIIVFPVPYLIVGTQILMCKWMMSFL